MKKVKINWIKFLSVFCIICISFLTVASCFAMAASGSPTSWDDVSEDVIALRDAYFEYFINTTSGDVFGSFKSASEIPVSWLKTVNDLGWCISPADNIYYYLKDGSLAIRSSGGGGRVRSGVHGGDGYCRNCKKPAAECTCDNFDGNADDFTPFVSGKYIKDVASDYNSRYMPFPNEDQTMWSYQEADGDKDTTRPYHVTPSAILYRYGKGFVDNKAWGEVYVMPFFKLNGDSYYYQYFYHFYFKKDDSNVPYLYCDSYSLTSGELIYSSSTAFNSKNGASPVYSITFDNVGYVFSYYYTTLTNFYKNSGWADPGKLYGDRLFYTGNSFLEYNYYNILSQSDYNPSSDSNDDWGFYYSQSPYKLFGNQSQIDFDRIPDNYYITINGDTIYDYSITNPDSGDTIDIKDYVDHDYDIPDLPDVVDPDDKGGSTSGNVTVGGKVDVSGDITIKSDPININVNVNSGSSSGGSSGTGEAVRFDQDIGLNNYYGWMQEQTTGFSGFMKNFFGWLPGDIVGMLCAGFALAILARFLGR